MKVAGVEQMRNMDKRAMEIYGIPEELLMENAALAAADVLAERETPFARSFLIICGMGNNGGDGLALGRKLHSQGREVNLVMTGGAGKYGGAAKLNAEIVGKIGLPVYEFPSAPGEKDFGALEQMMVRADVIVDALFGTGLSRPVEGFHALIITLINKSGKAVVSLDIPSGVNGDTGGVMGSAVQADATVTFGLPKYGNLSYPGAALCGKLYVSHISFPAALYEDDDGGIGLNVATNDPLRLPPRSASGHKGSFGDALFIAGARGYYGAPYFSAMAMLKAGGGYSRLAAPLTVCEHAGQSGREIVFQPMAETKEGGLALSNAAVLVELSEKTDFTVLGPGLSLAGETRELVRTLVKEIKRPLLLDGDAITAVAEEPGIIARRTGPVILTPHAGEFARFTGMPVAAVEEDRIGALAAALARFKCFILLKGAHSLIGFPDGRIFINLTGNEGMATAGSGDVLAGVIAAMYGLFRGTEEGPAGDDQGVDDSAGKALRDGVFLHGFAGDIATEKMGADGVTASDILGCMPEAVKRLRAGDYNSPIRLM